MSTATAPLVLPDLPGTGPALAGRLEALRVLTDGYFTNGPEAFATTVAAVAAGPAPQEFKDTFLTTLTALTAALRT